MPHVRLQVDETGSITIPPEYLRLLDIRTGDTRVLSLDDNELRIHSIDAGIRRAQALVREFVPEGRSLSEELIAERRAEAARENRVASQ